MLSGESTPQLKEPQTNVLSGTDLKNLDRISILSGGTKILQVTKPDPTSQIQPPELNGCIALVSKTGFSTQQGELLRMIIYSAERVTANNAESLIFILFLLVFALVASYYVWTESLKNPDRKRSKVLLDCILIITSVIPPELPMELSLAVNNSIMALTKSYIYCTEPFRIPFAGKIDIACFDKTGTLTAENLIFEGISGLGTNIGGILDTGDIPLDTLLVLAGVHALVSLDNETIGDPMERNTIDKLGFTLDANDVIKNDSLSVKIQKRFAFSSTLKRMSTVCVILTGTKKGMSYVGVKGAPEYIKGMCVDTPSDYDEIYKSWARKGSRVLALGYKLKGLLTQNQVLA